MMKNKIERNMKYKVLSATFALFFAFFITSCTTILDNTSETNLIGTWYLRQIQDANTMAITEVNNFSTTTRILGNIQGNALRFDSGSGTEFFAFYQHKGDINAANGVYDIDIFTLTFDFYSGTKLVRNVRTLGEAELIMDDTINSKAVILTFEKQ